MPLYCEDINASAKLGREGTGTIPQKGWTSPIYQGPNDGSAAIHVGNIAGQVKVIPILDLTHAEGGAGLSIQAAAGVTVKATTSPRTAVYQDKAVVDGGAGNNALPTTLASAIWSDLVLAAGINEVPDGITAICITGAASLVIRRN